MNIHVSTAIASHANQWSMETHHHPDYEVSIVLEGSAVMECLRSEYVMEKGAVVLIPPNVPHRFWTEDSVRFGVLQVSSIPQELVQRFYQLAEPERPRLIYLSPMNREIYESLFRNWLKIISGPLEERDVVISTWIDLFLLTLMQHTRNEPQRMSISSAADYIRNQFHQEVRVTELARMSGLSVSAFRKEFTRVYHVSPKQYQQLHRLSEAKWLLRTSDEPILRIAEQLGFSGIHLFSAWFQQMEGTSPSKWRKEQQGEKGMGEPSERF
ncbi:AraC family transcriptional regulator [Paenibacillus terrigena]|uniref:AraC family transcriptional regulator n=1 Tax=Paenibacillus terrigena TaxID=369333 RepID=UPI000367C055|nr:AraC family transcriptional regulator [Paenibacillus terrigena]